MELNLEGYKGLLVVGDVHSVFSDFATSYSYARKHNLYYLQLGDILDYGPKPLETMLLAKEILDAGHGTIIQGNHDNKLYRWAKGNDVKLGKPQRDTLARVDFGIDLFKDLVLEVASQAIQSIDPSRIVSSAHGDLPTKEVLELAPSINAWGLNIYRWDKPESVFDDWPKVSDKPIYFSELGADSYMTRPHEQYAAGENQQAQADANKRILEKVLENSDKNIGAFVFAFTDGLWKAGNPNKQDTGGVAPNSDGTPYDGSANEEYWGIVDIYRNKKITFDVVKDAYLNFDIK